MSQSKEQNQDPKWRPWRITSEMTYSKSSERLDCQVLTLWTRAGGELHPPLIPGGAPGATPWPPHHPHPPGTASVPAWAEAASRDGHHEGQGDLCHPRTLEWVQDKRVEMAVGGLEASRPASHAWGPAHQRGFPHTIPGSSPCHLTPAHNRAWCS